MAEHTPGPWTWSIEDHSMATLHGADMFSDHVMCSVPCRSCIEGVKDGEWLWGRCYTPTLANAKLIAAAPELLAALKAYLAAQPQCECNDHSGCPMAEARVLARAAIAKAEP